MSTEAPSMMIQIETPPKWRRKATTSAYVRPWPVKSGPQNEYRSTEQGDAVTLET
jgi:hypothetical protein